MQLDRVDAQARRPACGIDEALPQGRKAGGIECAGRRFGRQVRHLRRPHRLPAAIGLADQLPALPGTTARGFATGMTELNGNRHRGDWPDRFQDARQSRLGVVIPQTKAAGGDAPDRLDRGCLDHQQSGSRHGHLAEVRQMPVGRPSFVGGVLAHRRNHDAVGKFERAQLEGGKEHRSGHSRIGHGRLGTCGSVRHLNS